MIVRRRQNDPHELARALRGLSTGTQPALWEHISRIAVSMLIVVGEHDHKFTVIGRRMQQRQPALHLAVVPNTGHNVHEEQPDAFVNTVRAFLARSGNEYPL
jgi:2-succinyl-6-hydroxy-2,4-cyclohexadiene-1-carboxylate synthase